MLIFVVCCLFFSAFFIAQGDDIYSQYNLDLEASVRLAETVLQAQDVKNTKQRLAVMISFSHSLVQPFTEDHFRRIHYLYCALRKFYTHIGQYTPIDVYLWVSSAEVSVLPKWLQTEYPKVIIMPIPESSWSLPEDIDDFKTWKHRNTFNVDYHLNARWRLTFAMDFVRLLDYSYVLFTDEDAFMLNSIDFNIVELFAEHNIWFGVRERYVLEMPQFVQGLPEFTRYWMTIANYTKPEGLLFEHINPATMEGMTTMGWDRMIYAGCFMVLNVDFFFSKLPSHFRKHVLRSASDIEQRWTEQVMYIA